MQSFHRQLQTRHINNLISYRYHREPCFLDGTNNDYFPERTEEWQWQCFYSFTVDFTSTRPICYFISSIVLSPPLYREHPPCWCAAKTSTKFLLSSQAVGLVMSQHLICHSGCVVHGSELRALVFALLGFVVSASLVSMLILTIFQHISMWAAIKKCTCCCPDHSYSWNQDSAVRISLYILTSGPCIVWLLNISLPGEALFSPL